MKATLKFFAALFLVALIFTMSLPVTAYATAGTLGSEEPYMFCTFTDANDEEVDGNALTAGDYTVNVVLSGMEGASIFQYTANYDTSVVTALSVESTIADDAQSNVSCGGIKNENGNLVVVLASESETCSSLSLDGTVVATMNVTLTADSRVDFEDVFTFNDDPDLTFIEADYTDGYEDAYVIDTDAKVDYNTYQMTVDASPKYHYDTYLVAGKIVVATDATGTTYTAGKGGITVSVDGTNISATSDENGDYTLEGLPEGEYDLTVSGPTTFDRSVKLVVSYENSEIDTISVDPIPIIICDYVRDGDFIGTDTAKFYQYKNGDYYTFIDLNSDGDITGVDTGFFYAVKNDVQANGINYTELTLN